MTASTVQRLTGEALSYDVTMLGYNYRMDELRAAVGLAQLERLPDWNRRRQALTRQYRSSLRARCPGVSVPFAEATRSTCHILPALLPASVRRQDVAELLRANGIQTSHHYPPIHLLSWYRARYPGLQLPQTEKFAQRELTIPLHPRMQETDVDRVVDALAGAMEMLSADRKEAEHARA